LTVYTEYLVYTFSIRIRDVNYRFSVPSIYFGTHSRYCMRLYLIIAMSQGSEYVSNVTFL